MVFPQDRSIGAGRGSSITETGTVFASETAPSFQEPEIEPEGRLLAFWRILARRRWLVFIVLLSALIAAVAITRTQTPIYRTTLRLQIDADQPDMTTINPQGSPGVPYLPAEELLGTHCEALTSLSLATRVIRALKLENDPRILAASQPARAGRPAEWVRSAWRALFSAGIPPHPDSTAGAESPKPSPLAGAFASRVTAAPVKGSLIIEVSFESPDAVLAANVLNTLASEYIQMNYETRYNATIAASEFLARQLISLQAGVEQSEAELAKFEQAHGMYTAWEKGDATPLRPREVTAAPTRGDTAPPNWDASQYNILRSKVDTARRVYEGMLQRTKQAGLASGLKSGNVHVLDPAEAPTTPYLPDIAANMIKALAAGLLLGVAVSLLVEYVDRRLHRHLKTPEEVKQAVRLPFLGIIPSEQVQPSRSSRRGLSLRTRESGIAPAGKRAGVLGFKRGKGSGIVRADGVTAAVELVTHFDSKSQLSEAYRNLRASILLSASADYSPKTLLFTSSRKGEGKTATCVNLAITMAQANEKVLLVDCDLRNPSVHRIFSLSNTNGVSTFLTGTSTSSLPLIEYSQEYRLFVFPAGPISPNPAELFGSMRMEKCLAALAEHFDHILIDSPPLLSAVDAQILAAFVDGVVLVIKDTTTKEEVGRSERLLRDAHARILGTMLNNVVVRSPIHSGSLRENRHPRE